MGKCVWQVSASMSVFLLKGVDFRGQVRYLSFQLITEFRSNISPECNCDFNLPRPVVDLLSADRNINDALPNFHEQVNRLVYWFQNVCVTFPNKE